MPENGFGYDKMLEVETEFYPSDNKLDQLAEFMAIEPKKIPAGYTYLGQFIDHDIALDSATVERIPPWDLIPSSSISNKRTPFFNLETIYGFEIPTNPKEPARDKLLKDGSQSFLKLGDTVPDTIKDSFPNDLPRESNSPKAVIVDARNDENLAVAQTQVAFIKFHNAVVKDLIENHGRGDTKDTFEAAREIVIRHYQWIILKDFLPRIIKKSVLNDVLTEGNKFYFPTRKNVFMPLEFSVAAYRTGHSMIRNSYNWNHLFNDDPGAAPDEPSSVHLGTATLAELRTFTGSGGMEGKNQLPSDWLINWNLFYNIDNSIGLKKQKFNFASEINTKIASLLGFLNPELITFKREFSLPALDLYRTRAMSLPTGQAVAEIILGTKERILKPEQLVNLLPENLKYKFSKETPLWFYLLAEAEIEEGGRRLGEVGSRIVAETFVALLKLSRPSILTEDFQPNPSLGAEGGEFGMPQMLKFIRDSNKGFDELNPIREQAIKRWLDIIANHIK
jgi:ribosomal protein L14